MTENANSAGLLRSGRFGVFWFSSLLSNIGTWMQLVAEPWLVLSLSGSAFLLGLDGFAMNAPFWALILLGGTLADTRDRRQVIYFFQGIQMLCPLVIVALVLAGGIKAWIIIALSLVVGVTDALSMPSFQSIIPSVVAPDEMRPAMALNSIQFNLSRVLGPVLAGLVMAKYGPVWCFSANALSYIPFFFAAYWMLPRTGSRPAKAPEKQKANPLSDLWGIVGHSQTGWMLLSVFCTSFLCGPLTTFITVVVKDALHADAGQFGNVLTAFGAGGILGAIFIFLMARRAKAATLSLGAALLCGLAIVPVLWITDIWQMALLLAGAGLFLTVANVSANTSLQLWARGETRGQTVSLFMLAMRGGLSLGNLSMGAIAGLAGVQHTLMAGGLLAAAAQIFIFWKMRHHLTKNQDSL